MSQPFFESDPNVCEQGVSFAAKPGIAASNPAAARALALAQCNVLTPNLPRNASLYYHPPACGLAGQLTHAGQGGEADALSGERLVRLGCGPGDRQSCDWLQAKGLADPIKDTGVMLDQRINGLHDAVLDLAEPLCNTGNATACNQVGVVFGREAARGGDAAQVRELRQKAIGYCTTACAAPNIPVACDNLGRVQQDLGDAANLAAARVSLDKACAGGFMDACSRQALMLANGRGGARDEARAPTLYARACDVNSAAACNNLAYLWKDGRGGATDEKTAFSLFTKACDLNPRDGCAPAGALLISSTTLARDPVRGRALQKKGCDAGSTWACISYAESLRDGIGGAVDAPAARDLLARACKVETNERNCLESYADMAWNAIGGPADREVAANIRLVLCRDRKQTACCDWLRRQGLPTT